MASTAPALVKGATGIEPTGKTDRAVATKPEVLAPQTQGKAGPRAKMLPKEGKCGPELSPLLQKESNDLTT